GTETSTEFMQRFLRLAGFLGATTGTAEEQAKNFQSSGNGRDQRFDILLVEELKAGSV
nr:zinc finger, CCHC-type, retrotransposon Gag domain protein [Tanacetum cinerariifolium]